MDQSQKEIDILLERGQQVLPIEIKSGKTINRSYFKNIDYWLGIANMPEKQVALFMVEIHHNYGMAYKLFRG